MAAFLCYYAYAKKEDKGQRSEIILVESPTGYSGRSNSTGQGGHPGEIRSASHLYEFHEVKIQLGKEIRDLRIRHTWDIIAAAEKGLLPDKIMLNTHPQRWDDRFAPWVKELVWQNVKNVVKRYMIKLRN